jgi:hypothetical protein
MVYFFGFNAPAHHDESQQILRTVKRTNRSSREVHARKEKARQEHEAVTESIERRIRKSSLARGTDALEYFSFGVVQILHVFDETGAQL